MTLKKLTFVETEFIINFRCMSCRKHNDNVHVDIELLNNRMYIKEYLECEYCGQRHEFSQEGEYEDVEREPFDCPKHIYW